MALTRLSSEQSVNGSMVRVSVIWDNTRETNDEAVKRLDWYKAKVVARHRRMAS
jgi:hypothetical protein